RHCDAAEAVRILKAAAPDARRKLEALLSLQLLEAAKPGLSPAELRCLISQRAQERGLTEDRLRELFADDDVRA
ncbi:MAG TPA: hypothetical protein VID72_05495, partial [Ktedonobacterales bacterium]